jgi:hypothetical protein
MIKTHLFIIIKEMIKEKKDALVTTIFFLHFLIKQSEDFTIDK